MNKDLAGFSAIWRALHGVRVDAFTAYLHVVKEPPKIFLSADFGSVSEDGAQFSMLYCR